MNNLWVIITTINKPTEAVKKFDRLSKLHDFNLLIVGDLITPDCFSDLNCTYLSVDSQNKLFPTLSKLVPTRHYCRKNIGYAYAISKGAEYIFDTDDDNIPVDEFYDLLSSATATSQVKCSSQHCNVYQNFTSDRVWPRGLPLDEISYGQYPEENVESYKAPIQQFLADREPDVDAIYRLVDNKPVFFDRTEKGVVLPAGVWCPFNSQATLFSKSAFLNLYLPCYVPFRMTDIWRSFVAQIVLWSHEEMVSFHQPIVEQFRNEHDFMLDFLDEVQGYEFNKRICEALLPVMDDIRTGAAPLKAAYEAIQRFPLIDDREFEIISEWTNVFNAID